MSKSELYQVKNLLIEAARLGALKALSEVNKFGKKDTISQRKAFVEFGKEKIEMWDKMDMIKCKQRYGSTANSKINYSYTELLALKNATEMKGIFNI